MDDRLIQIAVLIPGVLLVLVAGGLTITRRVRSAEWSRLEDSDASTLRFGPRPSNSRQQALPLSPGPYRDDR